MLESGVGIGTGIRIGTGFWNRVSRIRIGCQETESGTGIGNQIRVWGIGIDTGIGYNRLESGIIDVVDISNNFLRSSSTVIIISRTQI